MPKLTVSSDTFLKKKSVQSSTLPDSDKRFLEADTVLEVKSFKPTFPQHRYVELVTPLLAADGKTQLKGGYLYTPHIKADSELETKNILRLPVPYYSQVNNDSNLHGSPLRQCNLSSQTMLADFLLEGELSFRSRREGYREPESYYGAILKKYGDTTDHDAHTRALKALGIESYFSYTLSLQDLLLSLNQGIPIVVGFLYKSSGHICVVVGHDPRHKDWFVHDPYGIRFGISDVYEVGVNGSYDTYSQITMNQIWLDRQPNTGWGRIVTSVNGISTGLPKNL